MCYHSPIVTILFWIYSDLNDVESVFHTNKPLIDLNVPPTELRELQANDENIKL